MRALALVGVAAAASQGAAPALAGVDLYLSTTGDDGNDGSSAAKALKTPHGAQAAVRKALAAGTKTPVTVHIGHGEYALTEPLALTLADSGSPGATVTWQAAEEAAGQGSPSSVAPVTFSAGQRITFSSAGKLWKADVSGLPAPAVAHGRQLYVNGRRAARSAEPGSWQCETTPTSPCTKSKTVWGDAAWQITNTSITIVDPAAAAKAQSWPNEGAGVEFVWSGVGGAAWAESRCQVESVASSPFSQQGGVEVKMSQPCLSCWASFKSQWLHHKVAAPTAIEAVGKPVQPGDWWLDQESKVVWYAPLPGESLGSAEAVMPVLETLVTGSGSGKTKLSDITFRGM